MSARVHVLAGVACLGLWDPGAAAVAPPVITAALTVREQYDDNVYLQDEAPLAIGQTAAALPANARALVTSVGASLGWSRKYSPALQLEATYAPEVVRYSGFATENHTDHRCTLLAAGTSGGWRYEARTVWLSTLGEHESPVFNRQGGAPPVGSEPVRARRAQDITRLQGRVTHDYPWGFLRGVLAWGDQDFHTAERLVPGYANYVDRGEWTVGPELGRVLRPNLFLVAAVRGGRQRQADLLGVPLNSSNTLVRGLVGLEGQPTPAWKFSLLAGPDFRRFDSTAPPGFDREQAMPYWEASATWTPTGSDTLTLGSRRQLLVSSGGRTTYEDGLHDLGWKRQLAPAWSVATSVNLHTADNRSCNPVAPRDDVIRGVAVLFCRNLGPQARLELGTALDWSRSGVPDTAGREYHRRIYTLGYFHRW